MPSIRRAFVGSPVRVWLAIAALAVSACRLEPTTSPSVEPPLPEPDGGRVAPGPVAVWTVARAADPELVHLHVQAAGAVGALLVPWVEGVTFTPCRVQVMTNGEVVQELRLRYEPGGRLIGLLTTGPDGAHEQVLERDARGRLRQGRGLHYVYEHGRLVRLTDDGGREHALRYDDDGRLVEITTTHDEEQLRRTELEYDGDRLVRRRFDYADGAYAETWFVYDERGRLVRVDVEETDAEGRQRRQPSLLLDYEGDRLVRFGPAGIIYDDEGRVATLTADDGTITEYAYTCPDP